MGPNSAPDDAREGIGAGTATRVSWPRRFSAGAGHGAARAQRLHECPCTRYQVEEITLMSIPRPRLPRPARSVAALVALALLLAGCAALEPPAAVTSQGQ